MKNVAVTGYFGTGSSAVIDLLREYENVKLAGGDKYEHNILLAQNCLLDLEARLFSDNTCAIIRDRAISDFILEMDKQYNSDFGWYGSYKRQFGEKFKAILDDFINSISEEGVKHTFAHNKGVGYRFYKVILQLGAKIF